MEKIRDIYQSKKKLSKNQLQLSTENASTKLIETNYNYKESDKYSLNKLYIKSETDCKINSSNLCSNYETNNITIYKENKQFAKILKINAIKDVFHLMIMFN